MAGALGALAALGAAGAPRRAHGAEGTARPAEVVGARAGEGAPRVTVHRGAGDGASGVAVVSERRSATVDADGWARLPGVPARLEPGSVRLVDRTEPGAQVSELVLEHDLATLDTLLGRYLGQRVTVVTDRGELSGILVRFDAQVLVLETKDAAAPLAIVDRAHGLRDVRLGAVPGGVAQTPTLRFRLRGARPGEHVFDLSYQTAGVSWRADYVAVVAPDGRTLDLSAWIGLDNQSGGAWTGAVVQLAVAASATAATAGAERLYALPGAHTLGAGARAQLELFAPLAAAPVGTVLALEYTPQYAYQFRQQGYPLVDRNLDGYGSRKFEELPSFVELDGKRLGAGVELPPGRLRAYRKDAATGALSLVSEAELGVGVAGAPLLVRVGMAKDVVAERRQVDYSFDDRSRVMTETMEITFKSTRAEAVEVVVSESLWRWRTWTIESPSAPATRSADGARATFRVKVPAGGTATLKYAAKYSTW